ncbi:MAG: class I SAM-dependent methyltransferase [Isosphaeraceae bacterium]
MAYDKTQATHEFTRWSESYDRSILQWLLFGPSHRAMLRRLTDVAGDRPLKVLDVGCGTGVFAAKLRSALPRAQVWGVDLVGGMLRKGNERWRRHAGSVLAVQGDSERLPFASGSFDFVTCANSFHHYPNQDRAVAEMRRVLRPGGRLLLIDGYRDAPYGWLIYDVCVAGVEGAVHHCSARRFRDLVSQAGFQAISQRVRRGFAPFLLTEAIAAEPIHAIPNPHFRSIPTHATEEAPLSRHSS